MFPPSSRSSSERRRSRNGFGCPNTPFAHFGYSSTWCGVFASLAVRTQRPVRQNCETATLAAWCCGTSGHMVREEFRKFICLAAATAEFV